MELLLRNPNFLLKNHSARSDLHLKNHSGRSGLHLEVHHLKSHSGLLLAQLLRLQCRRISIPLILYPTGPDWLWCPVDTQRRAKFYRH